MKRVTYTLTDEHYDRLVAASQPTPAIQVGGSTYPTAQMRADIERRTFTAEAKA